MATITEDYCSQEVYRLLREKGFDGEIHTTFDKEGYTQASITLQMARKWLREVHNIDIIAPPQYDGIKWTYSAIIFKLSIPCTEIRLNNNKDKKEEACEAAIKYCLESLINNYGNN